MSAPDRRAPRGDLFSSRSIAPTARISHPGLIGMGFFMLATLLFWGAATWAQAQKVVGYFPEWGIYDRAYQVADMPADKLTHVNYAFTRIVDNKITIIDNYAATDKFFAGTDSWSDPAGTLRGNFNQLIHLKEQYPHLNTLVGVGGWNDSGAFSGMASTAQGRATFAQSVSEFLDQYGFDGIDLDWEYPVSGGAFSGQPADKHNFTLLVEELRNTLGGDRLITAAITASPSRMDNLELSALSGLVDWFNIMTYDFHGSWDAGWGKTGHNSPLYNHDDWESDQFNLASAVANAKARGVPSSQIVPGLAFYGRSAAGVSGTATGLNASFTGAGPGTWEPGMLDYKDIAANYENAAGWTKYWDDVAKVPYLYNESLGRWISYDDPLSIQHKANYAAANGLGGVMMWELSADNGALMDAIYQGFGSAPPDYSGPGLVDDGSDVVTDPGDDPADGADDGAISGDFSYALSITTDWGSGYTADVRVTNNGDTTALWTVALEIEGQVTGLWNGEYTQSGQTITVNGAAWNRDLAPGASASFGFNASRPPASVTPAPAPSPTPLPTPDPTPDPGDVGGDTPANSDLAYNLVIDTDWGNGYTAKVEVSNLSSQTLDWELIFPLGDRITSLWDGEYVYDTEGGYYLVSGKHWNNTVAPGATVSFGFVAARN